MASKHRKTYDAIRSDPVRANISWNDAVTMAEALGAAFKPIRGSMYTVQLNGISTVLHRPHPGNEMDQSGVRAFRKFLARAGVTPDDL
jgi:hypothetical protein